MAPQFRQLRGSPVAAATRIVAVVQLDLAGRPGAARGLDQFLRARARRQGVRRNSMQCSTFGAGAPLLSLLMLDSKRRRGDLYRCSLTMIGTIRATALDLDGATLYDTVVFYKELLRGRAQSNQSRATTWKTGAVTRAGFIFTR